MSKQIYIDSDGNEIPVSGTINSADMMPMSASDNTKVSDACSYKSGDIITFNFQQIFTHIDTSGKRLSFFIPLNKYIPSGLSVVASGNYSVYFYDGSSLLSNHDISNDTQSITITPTGVIVTITLATALSQTLGYGAVELRNTFKLTIS